MIVCPSCAANYKNLDWTCPACGFSPERHDGFACWSPDLAFEGDGFNPECFAGLAGSEENHFWFVARNRLIVWALQKYFPEMTSFLEVGCGTGFVLRGVAEHFSDVRFFGSEIFVSGLKFAATRLPNATLFQMDARQIPFRDEFDVVAAFDVLEHIDEDGKALQEMCSAVKSGGGIILTVPQHAWLWSGTDDCACHKRRYSRHELHTLIESAGLQVIRSTSFVSLLLPAMMASRLIGGQKQPQDIDNANEFNLPSLLDVLLGAILRIEAFMIRLGVDFPLGGSRLVLARKLL